jgi:hypothetical protein
MNSEQGEFMSAKKEPLFIEGCKCIMHQSSRRYEFTNKIDYACLF